MRIKPETRKFVEEFVLELWWADDVAAERLEQLLFNPTISVTDGYAAWRDLAALLEIKPPASMDPRVRRSDLNRVRARSAVARRRPRAPEQDLVKHWRCTVPRRIRCRLEREALRSQQMARRMHTAAWAKALQRTLTQMTRYNVRAGTRAMGQALRPALDKRKPPPGEGEWIAGVTIGPAGMRRFRLFRPSGLSFAARVPLLVMLHGCGQDAKGFAASTRMNRIAARERFLVLYPEQDLLVNAQRCWNWYDTRSGRAYGEAALVIAAIDQVCLLYPVDRACIALAGLSAGASMAALLATRHPERFKAVVMHSGIAPGAARSSVQALGAMHGSRTPTTLPLRLAGAALPPLMVIHGGADSIVSAHNAQAAAQVWAEAAGARAEQARQVQRGKRHAMTITEFKRKGGSTVATLCEVAALGHAWSGGAAREKYSDMRGPDASRMVWAFAARQFRAAR